MGDWQYIEDHMGGHDEDGLPNFMRHDEPNCGYNVHQGNERGSYSDKGKLDESKGKLKSDEDINRIKIINLSYDIAKLISGLESKEKIKNIITKKIINDNIHKISLIYIRSENISYEYIDIVKNKLFFDVIIKGFFKKNCNHILNEIDVNKIKDFSESLYLNVNNDIVYDRVGKIQKFIHNMANEIFWDSVHLTLNIEAMRIVLSVSRLHLNIHDMKNLPIDKICDIAERSEKKSDNERINPERIKLPPGKKYIPEWRFYHFNSIYYNYDFFNQIKEINSIDIGIPLDDLKNQIIYIMINPVGNKKSYLYNI